MINNNAFKQTNTNRQADTPSNRHVDTQTHLASTDKVLRGKMYGRRALPVSAVIIILIIIIVIIVRYNRLKGDGAFGFL